MNRIPPTASTSTLSTPVSIVFFIATLYFGQDVLIPFALAVLLSFLLVPLLIPLQRLLGRIGAVLLVVVLLFGTVGSIGWVVTEQIVSLARGLPEYKENIGKKIQSLQGHMGGQPFTRAAKTIGELSAQLQREPAPTGKPGSMPDRVLPPQHPREDAPLFRPIPVRIVEPSSQGLLEVLPAMLGPLLKPLGTASVVLVLVIFMLLKHEDLRNRFISLVGPGQLSGTTQALDDAARRVSRYLLTQLLINATYGLPVALGLYLIGVPNAALWGVLATLLRFIPFLGPVVGAGMPILLSLAVFDGWNGPLLTIGLFVVLEIFSNNVMEPWLYGASTGISAVALIVAAIFWTWLWGPVGLILATPMTVCLAVMGRHVPQLGFLNVLLSEDEALSPAERYYQRLLAADHKEADQLVRRCLATDSLQGVYDSVLIPALLLAEQDHNRDALDPVRRKFIHQSLRDLVEDLGEHAELSKNAGPEPEPPEPDAPSAPAPRQKLRLVCLPATGEADEIAGEMLAQLAESLGHGVEILSAKGLSGEIVQLVEEIQPDLVVVSALPPFTHSHTRFLCKRLHARFPAVKLVVGLWSSSGPLVKTRERLKSAGVDSIVTTLAEAVEQLGRYEPLAQPVEAVPDG
jgi:predicted PurR-regulated permease PerM